MKRTQIYLDEDLAEDLRAASHMEGRSVAAIIRDAVRRYLRQRSDRTDAEDDPFEKYIGCYDGSPDASITIDEVLYGGPRGK